MAADDNTLACGDTAVGDVVTGPIAAPGAFAVGARIAGRYTIVRFLGRGGMGEVYEAEDAELHQAVAIKVLRSERMDDPRTVALLKREIATARKVTHPNVCRVFDVEYHQDGGTAVGFYTMELLRGESLADRLSRRGTLAVADAQPIVAQLCDALAAAHDAGVIHRDFKPHNVMLVPRDGGGERAVVTDFGLAVAMESADPTRSMELMGTPAYMAPEQLTGGKITAAVDIYALGVTLFELVTGKLPFSASTPLATALARVQVDAPSARALMRELDPRWDDAIRRCLARDPAERFATAPEVVAALRGAFPRRRWRWWALGALVAAGAVAALVALLASNADRRPVPSVFIEPEAGPVRRALTIGGAGVEKIEDATLDSDGNLVVVGHFTSRLELGGRVLAAPTTGVSAAMVIKIDVRGRVLWTRVFPSKGRGRIREIATTLDGTLVVAGSVARGEIDFDDGKAHGTSSSNAGFLVALSPDDGSTRWSRMLDATGGFDARTIATGPDGNLYVGGDLGGVMEIDDLRLDGGTASPWFASFTAEGSVRWAVVGSGGTNTRIWAIAFRGDAVLLGGSSAGEVSFAGASWRSIQNRVPFVAAFDKASGRPLWANPVSATYGEAKTIAVSPAGRVVVGGPFGTRIEPMPGTVMTWDAMKHGGWLLELDGATGAPVQTLAIGRTDQSFGISHAAFLDDERLIIAGSFNGVLEIAGETLRAVGDGDQYVAVLGPLGASAAASFGGAEGEHLRRLELREDGTIAIAGKHRGLDFGGVRIPTAGLDDGYYMEVDLDKLLE